MSLNDFLKKEEKHDDKSDKEPHRNCSNGIWIETEEEIKNWKRI